MNEEKNGQNQDTEFEQMMEQRLRDRFAVPGEPAAAVSDERLREMSKKLPAWSLEPPDVFLK